MQDPTRPPSSLPPALASLAEALRDPNEPARSREAIASLSAIGSTEARDLLYEAASDPKLNRWQASEICAALLTLEDTRAVPLAVELLRDPFQPPALGQALRAYLGRHPERYEWLYGQALAHITEIHSHDPQGFDLWRVIANPETTRRLQDLIHDQRQSPDRRAAAIRVLGRSADPSMATLIAALARDEGLEDRLRASAARALLDLGTLPARAALVQLLGSTANGSLRRACAGALKQGAKREQLPALLNLLKGEQPLVRRHAASILGALKLKAADSALAERLSDSDSRVRPAAIRALRALRRLPQAELLALLQADPSKFVRLEAALSLEQLGLRSLDAPTRAILEQEVWRLARSFRHPRAWALLKRLVGEAAPRAGRK